MASDGREWQEPLPTLTGRAWAFGVTLDAIDILPERYARLPAARARAHVFADLDGSLAGRLQAGDMVVVEEQRGTPASTHPALAALAAAGVVALVARTYAPGVAAAALEAGIVAVTLDAPTFVHTGDRVRVDLDAAKVVNLSSGDRAPIRNLDDAHRDAIRAMLASRAAAR